MSVIVIPMPDGKRIVIEPLRDGSTKVEVWSKGSMNDSLYMAGVADIPASELPGILEKGIDAVRIADAMKPSGGEH